MIAIEKIVYYSQIPREWGMPCHEGPHKETLKFVIRHRAKEEEGARIFIIVSWEGTSHTV